MKYTMDHLRAIAEDKFLERTLKVGKESIVVLSGVVQSYRIGIMLYYIKIT